MIENSTYNFLKRQCTNEKCISLAKLVFLNYEKDPISLQWVEKSLRDFRIDFNMTNKLDLQPEPPVQASKFNDKKAYYKDYRIKHLYVNNYRKFPLLQTPVGIDMVEDNKIRSLFLVGRNGIGKSSLYVALEAVCRGNISEAKLRNLNQGTYEVHNDIASNMSSTRTRIVETNSGKFEDYKAFFQSCGVDISACFCTENDIYDVGKTDFTNSSSLKDFFVRCLGFNYLLSLRKNLEILKTKLEQEYDEVNVPEDPAKYLESINAQIERLITQLSFNKTKNQENQRRLQRLLDKCQEYNNHLKRDSSLLYKDISEIIELLRKMDISTLLDSVKKLANLQFLLLDFDRNPNESSVERLEDMYQDTKNVLNQVIDIINQDIEKSKRPVTTGDIIKELGKLFIEQQKYEKLQEKLNRLEETFLNSKLTEEIDEFLSQINRFFEEEIAAFMKPDLDERKLIEDILGQFAWEDRYERENEAINIDYKEDKTLSISISYKENGELKQGISPSRYYNTFRFKLFCMMLRVAIAFTIMKREKIFFPLIWDDIFYSSDYRNKAQVKSFMRNIVQSFEKIFPQNKEMLQIICFTHDELIMKAFTESTKSDVGCSNNKSSNLSLKQAIFGRLFSYTEIYEKDLKQINETEQFNNLYTIIPVNSYTTK